MKTKYYLAKRLEEKLELASRLSLDPEAFEMIVAKLFKKTTKK